MELLPFLIVALGALAVMWFARRDLARAQLAKLPRGTLATLAALARKLDAGAVEGDGRPLCVVSGGMKGFAVRMIVHPHPSDARQTTVTYRVAVPGSPPDFSVARAGHLEPHMGRLLGDGHDELIGDEALDTQYDFATQDRREVRDALRGRDARKAFELLLGPHGFKRLTLRRGFLEASQVVPRKAVRSRPCQNRLRALTRVAKLFARTRIKVKETVLFAMAGSGHGLLCPFCRDGVDASDPDLHPCPTCSTVHHAECWSEAGGCTLLGCGPKHRLPADPLPEGPERVDPPEWVDPEDALDPEEGDARDDDFDDERRGLRRRRRRGR